MVIVELFTSPTCPHCPKAKLAVERALRNFENVSLKKYRITTPEGKAKAAEYRLLGVPAVFIDGEMIKGEITEEKIIDKIDKKLNPKQSFFSKLFKK